MLNNSNKENGIHLKIEGVAPIIMFERKDGTMEFYNEHNMLLAENVVEYSLMHESGILVFISNDNKYHVFDRYLNLIVEGEVFYKWKEEIISFLRSDNMMDNFLNLPEHAFKCTPFIDDSLKILRSVIEDRLSHNHLDSDETKQKEENDAYNLIVNKIAIYDTDLAKCAIQYLNSGREFNV